MVFHSSSLLVKSGSPFQHQLNSFVLLVGVIITFFVMVVLLSMGYVMGYQSVAHYMGHGKNNAETYAFIFSSVALAVMVGPSMSLLYECSSQTAIRITVKVIASQWYWNFEVSDLLEDTVSMYMSPLDELNVGASKYLEVDNRLVLPTGALVQFNVTSSDVIHSFALPTLGVKVDATAGLLSVVPLYTTKIGTHYGQCSEICGMNHAFMPFCLEVTTFQAFLHWILIQS